MFKKDRTYKDPNDSKRKLPSVTTITGQLEKPALMYWSVNCACDYLNQKVASGEPLTVHLVDTARKEWRNVQQQALDIGTNTHEYIHQYLTTQKEPKIENSAEQAAFLAFLEWKDKNKLEPITMETRVYGKIDTDEYMYAGTCDLICELNGVITLIDFKTAKDIYDEYIYQVAAYATAENQMTIREAMKIKNIGILRLDKETGYPEYVDITDKWAKYQIGFNHLCKFWWFKQ